MRRFKPNCCRFTDRIKNCPGRKGKKEGMTTLSKNCSTGKKKIYKITGDRKLCGRMASLGVFPGGEIEVIYGERGSQCLLKVQGCTLSLDTITSDNILVESL